MIVLLIILAAIAVFVGILLLRTVMLKPQQQKRQKCSLITENEV